MRADLFHYTLCLADDQLILGHRLSEWIGSAPVLEEELALGNIGLDLIGAARSLFTYAGEIEGHVTGMEGRHEDQLAYLRDAPAFRNCLLVELPNGDFAVTMARVAFYAAVMVPYWEALERSKDSTLAAIAAKSVKESRYHLRHAGEWLIRLGDGTAESHTRAQDAIEELWPYVGELFQMSAEETALLPAGIAVDRAALKPEWDKTINPILREATLKRPGEVWPQAGGRIGRHTEHLGHLLAVMQSLHRAHPGATW
jgi:ring-1,2-phenylacetyl-CoA epoxidase subunit PaaC